MRSNKLQKSLRSWTKKSAVVSLAFLFVFSSFAPVLSIHANAQAAPEIAPQNAVSASPAENSAPADAFSGPVDPAIPAQDPNVVDLASPTNSSDKPKENNSDKTKNEPNNGKGTNEDGTGTFSASTIGGDPESNPLNQTYNRERSMPKSDVSSGALVYDYPIQVPPGRNGLQPDLALSYNSQATDNDNIFGYGWNINIPYIERLNKKGSEKIYSEYYFSASGGSALGGNSSYVSVGELVYGGGIIYNAKIENGDFLKYEFSNNSWTVTDKSGTKYKFGLNASSRQDDPVDTTKIFKWMLEEVRDLNDNYVRYEYFKDAGQIYPSRIIYTGSGITDGIFTVEFSRQTRPDAYKSYKTAFLVQTNYRINEIQAKINGTWARKYTFSYATGDNSTKSLLSSITESGQDESSSMTTLPAIQFEYTHSTLGWGSDTIQWSIPVYLQEGVIIDNVNGDSFPDVMQSYQVGDSSFYKGTYISNGKGNFVINNNYLPPIIFAYNQHGVIGYNNNRSADLNGDGLADLTSDIWNYINNGNGWTATQNSGAGKIDINGDGFLDIFNATTDIDPNVIHSSAYINNGVDYIYESFWSSPRGFDKGDTIIADLNGDGLPDIMRSYRNESGQTPTEYKEAYLNNGKGGFLLNNNYTPPIPFYTLSSGGIESENGVRSFDVNGDGFADLVKGGSDNSSVYLNNGNGWTITQIGAPDTFLDKLGRNRSGLRIMDINGDGLADLVQTDRDYTTVVTYAYINKTTIKPDIIKKITFPKGGWSDVSYKSSAQFKDSSDNLLNSKLSVIMDLVERITYNDGLGNSTSTAYSYEGGKININRDIPNDKKFVGFSKVTETDSEGNIVKTYYHQGDETNSSQGEYQDNYYKTGKPYRAEIYDSSGNLYSKTVSKWESAIDGAVADSNDTRYAKGFWSFDEGVGTSMRDSSGNVNTGTLYNMDSSDWVSGVDGTALDFDGVNDYAQIPNNYALNSPSTVSAWIYLRDKNSNQTILSKGGGMGSASNYRFIIYNNNLYWEFLTSQGLIRSTSASLSSYPLNQWMQIVGTFDRVNSKLYINGQEVSTYPLTEQMVANTSDLYVGKPGTENNDNYFDGRIDEIRLYKRALSGNDIFALYNNPSRDKNKSDFAKLTQTIDSSFDGNTSHKDKAETYTYDNTNGNLTTKTQWGEVTGADDGTFTDIGSDKLSTSITYAANATLNILGLPSQEITTDQSANKINESKYYYDTLALGSVNKGNQTKEEKWKSGTNYIFSQKAYNSYGLVTSETDARNNTTSYIYDSYNLYPASVTNPLNQITQYTHDYSLGKPKQVTDPNGYVFQTVYDGLDRVIEEKQPDLAVPATLVTKSSYIYIDTPNTISIKKTDYLDATNGIDSYSYFDGLGRVIQTRKEAENANMYSVSDLVYNNRGLLQKESLLYFSTGSAKTSATTDNSLYSTYVYDPLERMTSTTNAVGTITSTYDDWNVTTTDAKGTPKTLYKDAYGNLIRVDEHNGANVYATNYSYDKSGNLLNITDALGNVRNFTYDALGGRLSAEDVHAPADPTFGTYGYSYDANGNLISKTDPKGQVVNYVYDALNRQTSEDYTGQAGTEATYVYDNCTGGKGRLCSVTNAASSETKEYDPLGLIKTETKTIDSTNYLTEYEYDRQGNETILTNPDNSQTKYEYNSAGLLEKVLTKENASSGLPSNTDLVGSWNFNEGTGIFAGDSSGSGHNGTLENMESSDWGQGVSGTALNFDGINERIDMGIMENVPAGQGITVSVWINPAELTSGGHVISRYSPSGIQYSMWKGENDVAFFINGGSGGNYVVAYDVLSTSTWTHLVGVFNDATKEHKLYANGVLIQSRIYNVTLNNPAVKTLVGTSNYYQDYFNGKIDEARVYNKVLTDAEILALYQNPSGSVSSNFTDLVTSYDYSPTGKVTSETYANGVSTTNTYDATKLYRLSSKVTTIAGGGHGQDLAYAYDANGNITRIVDNSATNSKKTADYTYDTLNRLLSATATGVTQSDVGIAGYWNFNESSGQVASDSSGNGNSGTLSGGMTNANWVSGISGNALDLDGGDDEIIVSDSSSLSPSLPITMSAWVKPDTLSGNRGIISKWNTSWETMAYAMMILPNGALRGFFADGTNLAGKDSVGGVISTGSWYHIVAVMRGLNDVGLYVNGQEVSGTYGGNATSTYDNTAPMRMGAIAPGSGNNIDGKLDEVRIYNRTLSSQEILDLYNSPGASGSQNYTETYAYDAIGNITNKSDQGNYAYSQTGKANPHAVTSMGSANYTYDDNGNLLTVTGGLTNTWDYDNRITQSVVGATTVTYGYDASGQRVKYSTGAGTTVYVNKYYEISPDGKIKKYVYGGNEAVATLETQSGATTTYYTHKDHLGGSSVITNSSGSQVELLDYYPFGSTRLDEKSGSFETSHKYTGKELDADTGLYYYGARYYNASVGRFVSQDPAYLLIGDKERFKDKYDRTLSMHLSDPQSLNSYSYVNNNPLKYTDPDGEIVPLVALAAAYAAFEVSSTAYDGYVAVSTLLNKNASNTDKGLAVGAFGLGLGTVGPGNAYVKGAEEVANKAGNVIRMTSNQIGKEGERILGEIVGPGDVHKMFNTSQGKRFVDRFTGDVIHEVKNGYVSATKFVQKQISKDAEIIENNPGLQSTWHLLRGGSENVKNIIQSFGSKVVDYSKKLK